MRILRSSNPKEYWSLLCTNGGKEKLNKIQLDVLAKYFADLNQDKNEYDDSDFTRTEVQDEYENQFLNAPFTETDILDVLCKLKCGKAAGPDGLINDFFKYSRNVIAKALSKLFNGILLSGSVPKEWADGWIVPIYKKKGSQLDPNNYRGISLINIICKIFTSAISNKNYSFFVKV